MPLVSSHPTFMLMIRILLLTLAYFVAGRMALLLAIPPGFATAIFPSLGIALAAVLLWDNALLLGVLLGSTWLNASIAIHSGAPLNIGTLSVAIEIALGSCLATWAGAGLIRKFVGFPNALTDERDIFLFFILGGPVAATFSATVGVSTLCINGLIPVSNYIYSWLTWWTGDAIGVLIAAPFVFIFFAKPRAIWRHRIYGVGIPLLVSCLLIVAVFIRSSQTEQQKIQRNFDADAQKIATKLYSNFENYNRALTPVKALFITSDVVTAEDFKIFTRDLVTGVEAVTALAWHQRVMHTEREEFEQDMVANGYLQYRITERNESQQLVPARNTEEYIVVKYIEPYERNIKAHGYNTASDATRKKAMDHSKATGLPAMSAPIHLVQSAQNELGYLVFMPVYTTLDTPETPQLRAELLRGYVTTALTINDHIKKIHAEYPAEKYAISFMDITDKNNPVDLYTDKYFTKTPSSTGLLWTVKESIGGRELSISVMPAALYMDTDHGLQSWYVLVGGLLFCSMLGGFLLLITGRAQHIASLVDQRTLELESILNEAVEAIIIVNGEGHVERANPAACSLFMLLKHQLIGIEARKLIPALEELGSEDSTNNSEIISNNCIWKSREAIGICRDNSYIPIEIGVSRVELPGRYIYTCMIHDITARKKVERLKSEFISTVSHELRTPLTSINGVLGLLAAGAIPKIPPKAIDLLVIAKNNADRLGRLVNDILDIEKLEFGQLQLDVVECEINDLIRQAAVQNSGYAIKYGVNLILDKESLARYNAVVAVDTDRFLQVMSNLISNAVKYSNLDGEVTIRTKLEDRIITIYVEDKGSGIPEAFRSRVFQKFAQADSSDTRKRDGTGLGLSITKVIVERMGGKINYTTELNRGTTFYFSLPVVKNILPESE